MKKTQKSRAVRSPQKMPEFPLNQILYGPPGTGKTYASIERAVEIIDGTVASTRAEIVARFEELRASHRVGFVTFHQSFAYEDFIEGLRPLLDEDSDGVARYEISDGAFKQMALRALAATLQFPAAPKSSAPTFEQLWDELTRNIKETSAYTIAGLGSAQYRLSLTSRGTIYGENVAGNAQQPYNTSRGEVWEKLSPDEPPTHNRIHQILERGAHTNLIGAIIKEMREIVKQSELPANASTRSEMRTPGIEDAREWLENTSALEEIAGETPRFVLIIDEINRGNIARIFGELITLLESDKRIGMENALRVTLPASKEAFGVPRNLYLLGTMNTADKSLALLDVALRRRFSFHELRPDFSRCENFDETMRQVLAQLNARLLRVLDREHRLGHAAWMNVATREDWNEVFAGQIVPLLQEYFHNDWENLRAILGENGEGKIVRQLAEIDGVKSRTRFAWWFDCDENAATPDFLNVLAHNFGIGTQDVAA